MFQVCKRCLTFLRSCILSKSVGDGVDDDDDVVVVVLVVVLVGEVEMSAISRLLFPLLVAPIVNRVFYQFWLFQSGNRYLWWKKKNNDSERLQHKNNTHCQYDQKSSLNPILSYIFFQWMCVRVNIHGHTYRRTHMQTYTHIYYRL